MGVSYYQPLAKDKVSIERCELEEVGGKVLTLGTRTILGIVYRIKLHNKLKSNSTME